MARTRWLTAREERAWRGYRRMQTLLDLQIRRDLTHDSGLSDADYEVLVALSETPGRSLRLYELADLILWSTSRLAHHADRMSQRGLVRKEGDAKNQRAAVIRLTSEGYATLEAAAPAHVESVRRNFIDLLTKDQIDHLADATETVIEHLRRGDPHRR